MQKASSQQTKALEDKPKPTVNEPTDAVVRVARTTICGADFHITKAYNTFGNAANGIALKVILKN